MTVLVGTHHVPVINLSYLWSILNFSYLTDKNGEVIVSREPIETRADPGVKWRVAMYPNGRTREEHDFISIYLRLVPDEGYKAELRVKLKCYIITSDGKPYAENWFDRDYLSESEKANSWGFHRFMRRTDLFNDKNKFLPGDTLTVQVDITYTGNVTRKTTTEQQPSATTTLAPFRILKIPTPVFEDHLLSDVILINSGKEFHAHKAILAARSPVFHAMFLTKPGQKLYRVEIPDLSNDVVKEMLRFIYTGEVNNIHEIVWDLLSAAVAYRLDDLKTYCIDEIIKRITVRDAPDLWIIAEKFQLDYFKKKIRTFICENMSELRKTTQYEKFKQSHPNLAKCAATDSHRNSNVNVSYNNNRNVLVT